MEDKIVDFLRPCGVAYAIRGLGRSITEINDAFFASKTPLITNILNIYAEEQENSVKVSCTLFGRTGIENHDKLRK